MNSFGLILVTTFLHLLPCTHSFSTHIHTQSDYVLVEYYVQMCNGRNSLVWIILGYVYILLTQIVAAFLAFLTRNVKINVFNESKSITLLTYFTSVFIIVMMICAITLDNSIDANAGVCGGLIMTSATIILGIVFVPKVGEVVYNSHFSISRIIELVDSIIIESVDSVCRDSLGA